MVWGYFSYNGGIIDGITHHDKYVQILSEVMFPYAKDFEMDLYPGQWS